MGSKEEKSQKTSTTMRLPLDLREKVQKLAQNEDRSETNMTITLLKEAIARREKKDN